MKRLPIPVLREPLKTSVPARVASWGQIYPVSEIPSTRFLQQLEVKAETYSYCLEFFGSHGFNENQNCIKMKSSVDAIRTVIALLFIKSTLYLQNNTFN